ncbi:hypothetical protein ACGFK1_31170 [Mycobacterium sp. NPDC048908]|uniref:hypothetical protein n=1 Tax=Mycobacterium sp. NPDC048908 TaxID=3364292 RepID=UPI003717DC60
MLDGQVGLDIESLDRICLNGFITRIPGKNRYPLTGEGLQFAIFYTEVHHRLQRPLPTSYPSR